MHERMKLKIKQLPTGYWHIRGEGSNDFCQLEIWPTNSVFAIREGSFPDSSREFRASVLSHGNEALTGDPLWREVNPAELGGW